jgi:hypothetical protein
MRFIPDSLQATDTDVQTPYVTARSATVAAVSDIIGTELAATKLRRHLSRRWSGRHRGK